MDTHTFISGQLHTISKALLRDKEVVMYKATHFLANEMKAFWRETEYSSHSQDY